MNSTSSGSGLRKRLGHRLHATVGDQSTTDLGLDLLLELLDAVLELVALESFLEVGQLAAGVLRRLLHQLLEHAVEIEVAQRAIEVVRPADGAPRLHAGEALHRLLGEGAHHRLVAVEQRLHEHLGDLLGRQRVHRAGGTAAVALLLLLHLAPHLVERALVALGEPVLGPAQ